MQDRSRDRAGVDCDSVFPWSHLLFEYKVSTSDYHLVRSY